MLSIQIVYRSRGRTHNSYSATRHACMRKSYGHVSALRNVRVVGKEWTIPFVLCWVLCSAWVSGGPGTLAIEKLVGRYTYVDTLIWSLCWLVTMTWSVRNKLNIIMIRKDWIVTGMYGNVEFDQVAEHQKKQPDSVCIILSMCECSAHKYLFRKLSDWIACAYPFHCHSSECCWLFVFLQYRAWRKTLWKWESVTRKWMLRPSTTCSVWPGLSQPPSFLLT